MRMFGFLCVLQHDGAVVVVSHCKTFHNGCSTSHWGSFQPLSTGRLIGRNSWPCFHLFLVYIQFLRLLSLLHVVPQLIWQPGLQRAVTSRTLAAQCFSSPSYFFRSLISKVVSASLGNVFQGWWQISKGDGFSEVTQMELITLNADLLLWPWAL